MQTLKQKLIFNTYVLITLSLCSLGCVEDTTSVVFSTGTTENVVHESCTPSLVPPAGKTVIVIGEEACGIEGYIANHPQAPGGFFMHTSIQEMGGWLSPSVEDFDPYYAQTLVNDFPDTILNLSVDLGAALEDIESGLYDEDLDAIGTWIQQVGVPVYLRLGNGFDHPDRENNPDAFVAAWRKIVTHLRDMDLDNVAFVWHSVSDQTFLDFPIDTWYPGDRYVDWVGISLFSQVYYDTMSYADDTIAFAKAHNRPIMIAESAPSEGLQLGLETWDSWFVPVFDYIENNDIQMFTYLNGSMANDLTSDGDHQESNHICANADIHDAWMQQTASERYLHQGDVSFVSPQNDNSI